MEQATASHCPFSVRQRIFVAGYTVIALLLLLICSVNSNAQSKDRDNPTQLTSGEISGLIDSETKGNFYYYTFIVNPGEVTITLSVESNPPLNNSRSSLETLNAVSFTLYDRNAVAIAEKKAAAYYGGATGQGVARVNISRRQAVVLAVNVQSVLYDTSSGKYRLRISGAVEFLKNSVNGISNDDPTMQEAVAIGKCLGTEGTLVITMNDGSKKIIKLNEIKEIKRIP